MDKLMDRKIFHLTMLYILSILIAAGLWMFMEGKAIVALRLLFIAGTLSAVLSTYYTICFFFCRKVGVENVKINRFFLGFSALSLSYFRRSRPRTRRLRRGTGPAATLEARRKNKMAYASPLKVCGPS
jgi:hypothetical protein